MKKITFIHAADLHLDSPMSGLKHLPEAIFDRLQESTFRAFRKITDEAINRQVDFLIISGDIFDGEDRSIRAQTRFRKEMDRLFKHDIQVYLIHGNHDHLGGSWVELNMPANVHIFRDNVEVLTYNTSEGTSVHLYGFSYVKKHVLERRINDYVKKTGADFHIGILHGNHEGNSDHGNYAPFHLRELIEKEFDYWALGHIHKRTVLSEMPAVVYPGNIQGRHKKETGMKGCYFVSLAGTETKLEFIPASDVIWEKAELDMARSEAATFGDLCKLCSMVLEDHRHEGLATILQITLKNVSFETQTNVLAEELLEVLQEQERDEESFVWTASIQIEERIDWDRDRLKSEADFYSELFNIIDKYDDAEGTLSSLYSHPAARKYLERLTKSEQSALIKESEQLLIRLLYQ
ncbi:DNA repair exonuclease [Bacillus canaveralius]|uniref:DNA repair exonuclease n=1 Tax=Bacillus canaveralius TaxID=1403243 RepID=A0A2N5GNG4_9BACI|nr:DNA repair exonuclease [Bacillus canaveralius]PLR83741.1 DNA repair exonuclease [Bacillus canaveralius]PLR96427.1 DNA repair exonuclease [Bacillus canaveralius]